MSIINDALKKTQAQFEPYKRPRNIRKVWFGIGTIGLFAILFINNLTQQKSKTTGTINQPARAIAIKDAPLTVEKKNDISNWAAEPSDIKSIRLEGIVAGRGEPYAIIENNILKEGNSIRGMKVVKISPRSVEVLYNNKEYTLHLE